MRRGVPSVVVWEPRLDATGANKRWVRSATLCRKSRPQPTKNCFRRYTPQGFEGQAGLRRSARRIIVSARTVPPTFSQPSRRGTLAPSRRANDVRPRWAHSGTCLIRRSAGCWRPLCGGLPNRCVLDEPVSGRSCQATMPPARCASVGVWGNCASVTPFAECESVCLVTVAAGPTSSAGSVAALPLGRSDRR